MQDYIQELTQKIKSRILAELFNQQNKKSKAN